jgi:hypothetical protein
MARREKTIIFHRDWGAICRNAAHTNSAFKRDIARGPLTKNLSNPKAFFILFKSENEIPMRDEITWFTWEYILRRLCCVHHNAPNARNSLSTSNVARWNKLDEKRSRWWGRTLMDHWALLGTIPLVGNCVSLRQQPRRFPQAVLPREADPPSAAPWATLHPLESPHLQYLGRQNIGPFFGPYLDTQMAIPPRGPSWEQGLPVSYGLSFLLRGAWSQWSMRLHLEQVRYRQRKSRRLYRH